MARRVIVWFSCGAASAVAAKLVTERYPSPEIEIVYCDLSKDEHSDNPRFMLDVENWIGRKVTIIRSLKYETVDDVFESERYMSGVKGARCTQEMKRIPRLKYQRPDDVHVFGFHAGEEKRIREFEIYNPAIQVRWVLRDSGINKQECYRRLLQAGIEIPEMYKLGYKNNNCIGCVKATSPGYWNKIRHDFPEIFQSRASRSRELGVRLVRIKGKRKFLDELPFGEVGRYVEENVSCGPQCGVSE